MMILTIFLYTVCKAPGWCASLRRICTYDSVTTTRSPISIISQVYTCYVHAIIMDVAGYSWGPFRSEVFHPPILHLRYSSSSDRYLHIALHMLL